MRDEAGKYVLIEYNDKFQHLFPEGPILGTRHNQFERDHVFVRYNRSAVVTGYRNQFFCTARLTLAQKIGIVTTGCVAKNLRRMLKT